MSQDPYRDGRVPPRFVCARNYDTATVLYAGTCACSGAPRLPLDNSKVVDTMRAAARARVAGKRWRWLTAVLCVSLLVALGLYLLQGRLIDTDSLGVTGNWWLLSISLIMIAATAVVHWLVRDPPTDAQALLAWFGARTVD